MLNGLQEDNWYICLAYINELLELNNSQHSRNTRGANFTILPRKYTREKEGGHLRYTVTFYKCSKQSNVSRM